MKINFIRRRHFESWHDGTMDNLQRAIDQEFYGDNEAGGGTIGTYSWYRFVDQPSLQGFGWSTEEKNRLQTVMEKIHANWKNNTEFMAPQTVGDLVTLDTALLVSPPRGMEIGYVPIVTRQSK